MDDNKQRALFYDSYRAALREDCKAIEPSLAWAKVVGKILFPEITDPIEAGRLLNDKTNPNRRDRLSDEQERFIMRLAREKRGFSAALDFICDDTEFERTKPRDRRDEALELQARAERTLAEFRQVTERYERLVRAPLAVIDNKKSA